MFVLALIRWLHKYEVVCVKRNRSLYTDEEVARARKQVREDPGARRVLKGILEKAGAWVNREDAWLEQVITPASIPRAFNVHHLGCPIHGMEYFKHGNYSFKFSLDRPWKIVCPVGGEEYPSNDFRAFFTSGMKDRNLLTGEYPDDGWGWRKPGDGKKWWFVAYYNHWAWMREIIPGVLALSRAYLLTGDVGYAHKAGLLLYRIADVYPEMDHNKQSRYATEFVPSYQGRILNCIWECGLAWDLAEAYDNVFDGINQANTLHERLGKSNTEIHAHIDQGLMAELVSGVYKGQIRGNFGMCQHALLTAAIVRQAGDEQNVVDFLLKTVENSYGIDLVMHNIVHRDGVSMEENSPGYAWSWVDRILRLAEMMNKLGVNLYARHPKIRQMLLHPLRETVIGKYTPNIGDSFGVMDGLVGLPRWAAEIGYREYKDPYLLAYLRDMDRRTNSGSSGNVLMKPAFEDLFQQPVELPSEPAPPKSSLDVYDAFNGAYNHGGYGLALLRSGQAYPRAVALWYGTSIGHGHPDKLMVEVYAKGKKILPDLGYPQFTDDHPEADAWVKNTISHATVVVNAQKQTSAAKGDLHMFGATSEVQVAEASAETNYPGIVSQYRRTVGLVDVSERDAYVVDVFRVSGGRQHDYSLHGPYGDFVVEGLSLSEPAPGTLAGPDVPYAFLYDDEELKKPGAQGFERYKGSGLSYLKNSRQGTASMPWRATWRIKELGGQLVEDYLTIMRLPMTSEAIFVADGIPPLRPDNPPALKYLISRREGQNLSSTFVSLFVPHTGKLFIRSARLLPVPDGTGVVAVAVDRGNETDVILSSLDGSARCEVEGGIVFKGRFGALTLDAQGAPIRASLFGEGELRKDGVGVTLAGDIAGTVMEMDPEARTMTVAVDNPDTVPDDPGDLVFREAMVQVAVADRPARICGLRVHEARRSEGRLVLGFGPQDLQVALLPVEVVDAKTLQTKACLPLASVGYYDGAYATDKDGRIALRVRKIESDGKVHLEGKQALHGLKDMFLCVFEAGPGDRIRIHAVGRWHR